MRIRIIWFVLLAIVATPQADRALAQESEVNPTDRFQLFNECRPMSLIVEGLPTAAAEIGLNKASIQAAVESRLRSARLYSEDRVPYLYVAVNVVEMAFNISLDYNKLVDDPASDVTGPAALWKSSALGTHGGDSSYILSSISGIMDGFLVEYLRVNESACK